jgi:hypothetical protein
MISSLRDFRVRTPRLGDVAAASASADLQAEHNHDRSRKMANERADEPPQAHDYRIGGNAKTDIPRGVKFTPDSHEPK